MRAVELGEDNKIKIPEEYANEKRLVVRTPWMVKVIQYDKKSGFEKVMAYFRSKDLGHKPYVPEGFVEINGERFKVVRVRYKRVKSHTRNVNGKPVKVKAYLRKIVMDIGGEGNEHQG